LRPRHSYQEEQAVDLPSRDTKSTAKEFFYLQVGSFQNAPEADNLKAQVALIGLQATIQTISSAERGVLHRVRLGPFGNVDDVNRNREILKKNGIEATLIKGRDSDK
jgi:cell division protein FtsN